MSERRSAVFSGVGSDKQLTDNRPVTHKPPTTTVNQAARRGTSPTRQSKPPCPPPQQPQGARQQNGARRDTAGQTAATTEHGDSMHSHHDPSSHFHNVCSFSTVASRANVSSEDQCIPDASQSASRQDAASARDARGLSTSPDLPDYLSRSGSGHGQTSMVTPPLVGHSGTQRTSGHRESPVRRRCAADSPDARQCDQSTPMPGHVPDLERSFSSRGATFDPLSRAESPVRGNQHSPTTP